MTLADFRRLAADLAERRIARAAGRALAHSAMEAEGEAKRLATTRLRVRTGHLRRSISARVEGLDLVLEGGRFGGRTLPYARMQLMGETTTVRPKGRYLAQPIGPALTASGVARYRSPRQVPGLRFIVSKRGNALLIDRKGTPWYLLHRSVTVKGANVLPDGLRAAQKALPQLLAEEIRAEFK